MEEDQTQGGPPLIACVQRPPTQRRLDLTDHYRLFLLFCIELKMAVSRIQIASNKKSALLKQSMREIAVMLAEDPPKEEKAKIRAEALIRDDNLIEAYEILQLQCELLHERIKLLEYSKECPGDLISVISSVMWASQRVDIPELVLIRKQFRAKYGKKFDEAAMMNHGKVLNDRIVSKLSIEPPAAYLVQTYLERICEQFEVDWKPKVRLTAEQMVEPMSAPSGYSIIAAQGTGLGPGSHVSPEAYESAYADGKLPDGNFPDIPPAAPHSANTETTKPYVPSTAKAPASAPASTTTPSNKGDDFEEVDIFVPPAASSPAGQTATSPITMDPGDKPNTMNTKNSTDDDRPGRPSSSGSVSTSYADLAARFNQLKK